MQDHLREDTHEISGHSFVKKYSRDGVSFFMDGREVKLDEWNRALNRVQPMSILESHPNRLVRMKEMHRRSAFTKMINMPPGAIAADIGCEEGQLAALISPKCKKLICIDIDPAVLSNAQNKLSAFGNIEYVTGDVRSIPLPDNFLDICVAAEVLEHLPNPEEGINELVRITKPDGKIYISVPNEKLLQRIKKTARLLGFGKSLGKLSSGLAVGHVHVFDKKTLESICNGRIKIRKIKYSFPFCLNIFAFGDPVKKQSL